MDASAFRGWDTDAVCRWLEQQRLDGRIVAAVRDGELAGSEVAGWTTLKELKGDMPEDIPAALCRRLWNATQELHAAALRAGPGKNKVFNDAVHGHITLPAVCVAVIDTPQFQRLKDLKQLGGVYYIFSCASHNRFEHSIGTAHLGGRLARHLRHEQPELNITDKDITCVQLAGLCHDLGHGPCSHMFEHFLEDVYAKKKQADPDGPHPPPPTHEFLSTRLLDHLIEKNDLMPIFEAAGLDARDMCENDEFCIKNEKLCIKNEEVLYYK